MRRKFMTRVTAVTLSVVMAMSFAGCGMKKDSSAKKEEGKNSETLEDMVTVKIGRSQSADFTFGRGESWEDNAWLDLYKENGIDVDVLYQVDPSNAADKLAQTIASGNYPDVMVMNSSEYANYAAQGVIMDITDMCDEYLGEKAKDFYAMDDQVTFNSGKLDGKLYGLPLLSANYDSVMLLWVRADWLRNLGLESPKTMDDVLNVARAFTNNDPDGNGIKDTYGFSINGKEVFSGWSGVDGFMGAFGANPDKQRFILEDNEKVIWGGANEEGMIEGLTVLSTMYEEGLIPQDFVTSGGDQIIQDITSGKVGMFYAPMSGVMMPSGDALATQPEADFECIGIPIVGDNEMGKQFLYGGTNNYVVCSSKFENPEVFFKIFNLAMEYRVFCDDEEMYKKYITDEEYSVFKTAIINAEPPFKNHENYLSDTKALESDDFSKLNAEQKTDMEQMQFYLEHVDDWQTLSEEELVRFKSGLGLYSVFLDPQGGYAALDKMIQNKEKSFFNSAYNGTPTTLMAEKFPVLNKMAQEFIINVIVGNKQPLEYSDFLENWYAQGGAEITKEAQQWYDANLKK